MRFFRIYYDVRGGFTHTRWFSGGNPNAVMGKCGELTFLNDEWIALRGLLQHSTVSCIARFAVPATEAASAVEEANSEGREIHTPNCICAKCERENEDMKQRHARIAASLEAKPNES